MGKLGETDLFQRLGFPSQKIQFACNDPLLLIGENIIQRWWMDGTEPWMCHFIVGVFIHPRYIEL